jgi:hypothetical protein
LLLISGHTEHLWIRIKIVFGKARKSSKMSLGIGLLRRKSPVLQRTSKIRSINWLRSRKIKSRVVNIQRPMFGIFELIPKRERLSIRLQS